MCSSWIRSSDLLEEKQKHLTCVQINGDVPDGGTVVKVRGKKCSREGNETPEKERRTKKMRRTPTLQSEQTSQSETSPKRRLMPTRRKTLQEE
jgi:hypothetical protein